MVYYDDDEDIDIHVRHRGHSPRPVRYVQSPPRPRYYPPEAGPSYLVPEHRTTVLARTRSHSRSRSRDRYRASPPAPPPAGPAQPVIINNRFYNEYSSDSDSEYERRTRNRQVARRRASRSSSRERARMTREDWEAENTRRELEHLRLTAERERAERRITKDFKTDAELQQAKRELDEIKRREALAEEEKRIKKELEHKRLKEEREAAEEAERIKKEAEAAVERYKQEEAERRMKEAQEREEAEKEYKRRLQEDLVNSGVDEKAIAAIMKKEKVPEAEAEAHAQDLGRPTYTRMARKHLSIETLRTYSIEWDYDPNPEYVLIKRWVPEWEQDTLWKHTRYLRSKRGKALLVEEKKRHDDDPRFEWVRKKSHSRKRSKSPGLLMYLAGARPA
ncbi:Reticulocyte-binding protein 2 a-like protein [Hapsidospora chrysogenum ATCC 11550]|uniref:Reticulocyte-binding protein 2 a-like protein n=1 Tax=Hapsidospora chrysogenum (strain ATCC 11550 / CBS 779.69 / DSM 880 / IAM 14645 / JCM 23072 / IMI 49137) TaxID=857340 RepID=A0A086SUF2_HAPC1|nr:Reticulocyte-binding protein 2 a-like protein [Hapsidospora chrysogenum ATCC 11550]